MQRYVAACCAVFVHKQACLSISRCKRVCGVISPETIGAARLGERCWSLPVRAAVLSGCSRRSHLIGDLSPGSRTRGVQSFSSSLKPALPLQGGEGKRGKKGPSISRG